MPIHLGETRQDIPYNRAYLGDQIIYDSSVQLDHTLCVYDRGTYGTVLGTFSEKEVDAPSSQSIQNFATSSLAENAASLSYVGIGKNIQINYGGFATSNSIELKGYGSLYAKMRTTAMGKNTGTFMGLFTDVSNYMNLDTATKQNTLEYSDVSGTTHTEVVTELEPDVLLNFNMTGTRRIGFGTYSLYETISGTVDEPTGVDVFAVYLFKNDNWRSLAKIAGITPTTMDDLIQSASTLLANEDAVDYMITRCTGTFMINALKSSTFMAALNSSTYKSQVLANEIWSKFIDLVYDDEFAYDIIPMKWTSSTNLAFTTNTTLGAWGLEASLGANNTYNVKYGIDLDDRSYFSSGEISSDDTVLTYTITPPVGLKPKKITLKYSAIDSTDGRIQGLANGAWTNLATIPSNLTAATETFTLSGNTFYEKIRIRANRWNSNNRTIRIYTFAITSGELDI